MDDIYSGPNFYDNDEVFARYQSHRHSNPENPNDTIEKPIFEELIGKVTGLNILDLGCGDAAMGRELLERGANAYLFFSARRFSSYQAMAE